LSEILCVVNVRDELLRGERRKLVHTSGLWHRGVHMFLFNEKDKLLVQLRSETKDKFAGRLDCSVSEHVRMGETYEEAAARGLVEELGLTTRVKPLLHFRMNYGPNDNMVAKLFKGRFKGPVHYDSDEVAEVMFMTVDEQADLVTGKPETMTPWFAEMLKWKLGIRSKLRILNSR
jgi:isopentenyldiphosphate isomerase